MADIKQIIKDLQGNFSGSNENQYKGTQLLIGLSGSDDPLANEFMDKLDKATTKISKEVLGEKKKESIEEKKIEIPLEGTNLYFHGFGRDVNGNATIILSFPDGRKFSFQNRWNTIR